MKKTSDEMRPEYDFSGGIRGKYAAQFRKGSNVVVLEPEIAKVFPNSKAVNDALRSLVEIAKHARRQKPSR